MTKVALRLSELFYLRARNGMVKQSQCDGTVPPRLVPTAAPVIHQNH